MMNTLKALENLLRENGDFSHWASDFNNAYNENHIFTCKVKDIETFGTVTRTAHLLTATTENITTTTIFRDNGAYTAVYCNVIVPDIFAAHISEKYLDIIFEILWEE